MEKLQQVTQLKTKILAELNSARNNYESAELFVTCTRSGGEVKHVSIEGITIKENQPEEIDFPEEHDAYTTIFSEIATLNLLNVKAMGDVIEIFGDVAAPEFGITQREEFKNPLTYLYQRMNPHLEDGYEYINTFHVNEKGKSGLGLFYKYDKGVKSDERVKGIDVFDQSDLLYPEVLKYLVGTFEPGQKTKVIARKDQPIEVRVCTPAEIIEDIYAFYNYLDAYDEINFELAFHPSENSWAIVDIQDWGEIRRGTKTEELSRYPVDDYEQLYLLSNKSIKKMKIHMASGNMKVYADQAFPALGIEQIVPQNYSIANDDLATICKFIESGNEEKIAAALKVIPENETTKTRVEKRYLNFVRAYLENEQATLQDIRPEMFSEKTRNICLDHRPDIDKDYINFGYKYEAESKLLIDFVGAMVKNYVDIDQYIQEHDELYEENMHERAHEALYKRWSQQLKRGIAEEIKLYPEGWYSQSYKKLLKIGLRKILTDKSSFFDKERMPLLREYMFYLSVAVGEYQLHIDAYNSYMHDLTEVFWMFYITPQITWFQTTPAYPPIRYKKRAKVEVRIDNDPWQELEADQIKSR
ncbi:hypothetical protein BKI52_16345 [marine bacterium AO1-C]|nr:hypothetical protein BKI52_16345 [marine bacterium AO1-C]